ncbi:MAG: helix-turn-helix transcriptional regulator [Oscillospiraceae bacterium]|nr:helix-turn-helix transcriptional regulator [Oscillospiraceae bacterium]
MVEKIRALCKKRGISIWALEKKLGIGNGVVARWAQSSPRVESIKAVADFFGITVDELLRETEVAGDDAITGRHSREA